MINSLSTVCIATKGSKRIWSYISNRWLANWSIFKALICIWLVKTTNLRN